MGGSDVHASARHAELYRAITASSALTPIDDAMIEQACQAYGVDLVGPLPDQR